MEQKLKDLSLPEQVKSLLDEQTKARAIYADYLLVKQAEGDNHGIWDIAVELYKLDYTINILNKLGQ